VEIQPEQVQTQVMLCQIVTQSLNTSLIASHTLANRSVYSKSDLLHRVALCVGTNVSGKCGV
jgi:hypothetical protein